MCFPQIPQISFYHICFIIIYLLTLSTQIHLSIYFNVFPALFRSNLQTTYFAGKGEKERYAHLNAEFQRIARRNKKDFYSDQCTEIGENSRMGKTRDFFKKIIYTIFHSKMDSIKDRNGMDLTEAEDNKKRWQEYTEELHKKSFMIQMTMMV